MSRWPVLPTAACSYICSYGTAMDFEWDEAKRLKVLAERDVDFLDMTVVFDGRPALAYLSVRGTEERWVTVAEISGKLFTVIWIQRENALRIITARRARHGEEREYRKILHVGDKGKDRTGRRKHRIRQRREEGRRRGNNRKAGG